MAEMSNAWERPEEYLQARDMQKAAYEEYMGILEIAVVESVSKGVAPWAPNANEAINASTGREYRGDNGMMLTAISASRYGGDPRYFTASDLKDKGIKVRDGEQGVPAFYYENSVYHLKTDENGNVLRDAYGHVEKEVVKLENKVFRPYLMYNAQQLEGNVPPYQKEFYPERYKKVDRKGANDLLESHGANLFKAVDVRNRKDELEAKGVRFKADGMIDFSDRESMSAVYFDAIQRVLLNGRDPSKDNLGLITEIAAAKICDKFGMDPMVVIPEEKIADRMADLEKAIAESKGFSNVLKRADSMAYYFRNPNRNKERDRSQNAEEASSVREQLEKTQEKTENRVFKHYQKKADTDSQIVEDARKLWGTRAEESEKRVMESRVNRKRGL